MKGMKIICFMSFIILKELEFAMETKLSESLIIFSFLKVVPDYLP